jgi:hypothetical protein
MPPCRRAHARAAPSVEDLVDQRMTNERRHENG